MHNSRAHLGEGAVGGRLWGARGRGRSPAGRFPGLPAPSSRARLLQPRRASPNTALAPHGPPCDLLPALPASRTPGPELAGALRKAAAAVTVHHPASAPRLCRRVPRPAGYRPRVAPQPVFQRRLCPGGDASVKGQVSRLVSFLGCGRLPKRVLARRSHQTDQSSGAIWFSSSLWQMPRARCRRGKGKKCQKKKKTLAFAQHFAWLPSSSGRTVPSTRTRRWSDSQIISNELRQSPTQDSERVISFIESVGVSSGPVWIQVSVL